MGFRVRRRVYQWYVLVGLLLILGGSFWVWLGSDDLDGRQEIDSTQKEPSDAIETRAAMAATPANLGEETPASVRLWTEVGPTTGAPLNPLSLATKVALLQQRDIPGRTAHFSVHGTLAQRMRGDRVEIGLPGGRMVSGAVNLVLEEANGIVRVGGSLDEGGSFSLTEAASRLHGRIVRPQAELAYVIAGGAAGEVSIEERWLSTVLCFNLPREPRTPLAAPSESGPMAAPPLLSSRPSATAVLYLDFDGETVTDPDWNGGNTINAAASNLSSSQIEDVWRRVTEDFLPFNVDVTTDLARYQNAPVGQRMRVIVTPTNDWAPKDKDGTSLGGIAYLDSYSLAGTVDFASDVPVWVFNTTVVGVAEAISHELGHAFGLGHDGRASPAEEYYAGHGSGSTSWAPIMGVAYYRTVTQWSNGEYENSNNLEDDVAIIAGLLPTRGTGTLNEVGYALDEAGDAINDALGLPMGGANEAIGSVGHRDADYFKITVPESTLTIQAGVAQSSPNLDILLQLLDEKGSLLVSANPEAALSADLVTYIPSGSYFIRLSGIGKGEPRIDGYSDYASMGYYRVVISVGAPPGAPVFSVHPESRSLLAGQNLFLKGVVSSVIPVAYQWFKNGVPLAGQTYDSLLISPVTLTDVGEYQLQATNATGVSLSSKAFVTVNPSPPPEVYFAGGYYYITEKEGISFSPVGYNSVPITYEWFRDGVQIASSNTGQYRKDIIGDDDTGSYYIIARNQSGSRTTPVRDIKVGLAAPVRFGDVPHVWGRANVRSGTPLELYGRADGSEPILYRWYRNGAEIPGATGHFLSKDPVSVDDLGTYSVVASNAAGSVKSRELTVEVEEGAPLFPGQWTDSREAAGIMYFLFKETARIARYDLAARAWLADFILPDNPTAFAVQDDGIFVAFGGRVSRYRLDLSLVNEFVINDLANVVDLQVVEDYLVAVEAAINDYTIFASYDRWSGEPMSRTTVHYRMTAGYSAHGPSRRIFGTRASDAWPPFHIELSSDGHFAPVSPSYDAFAFPSPSVRRRTFVMNDGEWVVDHRGIVYSIMDGRYVGSLGGGVRAMVQGAEGVHYALRGSFVHAYDGSLRRVGSFNVGRYAEAVCIRNGTIVAFSAADSETGAPRVHEISAASISPPRQTGGDDSPEAVTQAPRYMAGDDGVIYIHPRDGRSVLRWSTELRRTLPPIRLSGQAAEVTYSEHHRSVFAAIGQDVRRIAVDDPLLREVPFHTAPVRPSSLTVAGAYLHYSSSENGGTRRTVGSDGFQISRSAGGWSSDFEWAGSTRRLYFYNTSGTRHRLIMEEVDPSGVIGNAWGSISHDGISSQMISVSPDGEVVLTGSGVYYDKDIKEAIGAFPGQIEDALWSDSSIFTVSLVASGAEVQKWGLPGYTGLRKVSLSGVPRAIFSLPNERIAVVTTTKLVPRIWVLSQDDLSILSEDEFAIGVPSIVLDPLAKTAAIGTSTLFSVQAEDAGALTYQWHRNGEILSDGERVQGARSPTLELKDVRLSDRGEYSVTIRNDQGGSASRSVLLTVPAPPRPLGFAAELYLARHPAVAAQFAGMADQPDRAWGHYLETGVYLGYTDGDFDAAAYLEGYPSLRTQFGSNFEAAAVHWYTTGRLLGLRIPGGFDVQGYLARHPEQKARFASDLYGAWLYYRDAGVYDGEVYDEVFRPEEYLALYPELLAALGPDLKEALLHWLGQGRIEGRLGRIPLEFDSAGYFERNPDVAAAVGHNLILGWQHFWSYGIYEGRAYDEEFRVFEYLALNQDLQAAFLEDWRGATLHWLRYGRTEGRLGRVPLIFNVDFYLGQYPDVESVFGRYPSTVFQHYYFFGVYEARIFDNEFRVDEYIALNPDLQAVFGTDRRGAFMHWVRWGRSEGRQGRQL